MDVVAVDWSGAKTGSEDHIWSAHVRHGTLLDLRNGRSRPGVVADLIARKEAAPEGLTVGLDFSFSLPAWFLRQRGHTTVTDLWHAVAAQGEEWLATCDPPFWGRPGRPRPDLEAHLRQSEAAIKVGGISTKSPFQIGGAGSVGTGSLRGMPHLLDLRAAGFSIWPSILHQPGKWSSSIPASARARSTSATGRTGCGTWTGRTSACRSRSTTVPARRRMPSTPPSRPWSWTDTPTTWRP